MREDAEQVRDVFVIGGGVNGCGIARDAAGRGLSVTLAEQGDLAQATSSASTKLFHGGLRYLEYLELRLVRESLIERERLLRAMPHIAWPMRFVLPFHRDMRFESDTPVSRMLNAVMPWMKGRRPAWLIRAGLFLYDTLGGREILPGTARLDLATAPEGRALRPEFRTAYEYSDCWVQDSRLVVLNARDAEARGAEILTRTRVVSARAEDGGWRILTRDAETGAERTHRARMLVNAGGPWVGRILRDTVRSSLGEGVRLVRGSHIVTPRLFDHDKAYFFQGTDGRIAFALPYEQDFTLIGTTDRDHADADTAPECTDGERRYLIDFVNGYLAAPISEADVVWSYAGVRPLHDDGAASASAATRDYTLRLDDSAGAPVLHVFGGKITTYRRLAEGALAKIAPRLGARGAPWTAGASLPGGDFPVAETGARIDALRVAHPFLTPDWALRLFRTYGTETGTVLRGARTEAELGRSFGGTLTEAEVDWLMDREYARTPEDVLWRRTRLGLRLDAEGAEALGSYMNERRTRNVRTAAE
ncbi:glycerol-3-phosphate dehydrogenase [Roseivivax isoporae]|uniref:Glycerol-3-phosphate dehydrogenase n=1 Tax=Roseivivax isoporae LMG 25204 TaxID=1449351 RepID=X7FEB4_9RHOB|nr:glycerol-3-phosphate dehydrogenase [Roseivivax isoporae]ETX30416.1 glycerol-3-phosphate dehydrogenase [Roseivivax isoporae LMG 25204]